MSSIAAKTVLLIEDGDDDRLLFRKACERAAVSFSLKTAASGPEAIAYIKGEGVYADRQLHPLPSLVILDVNMPVMSGFEVLAWIRSQPTAKHLIVVIFTSSSSASDIDQAYSLLANSYLVKPVNVMNLIQTVSTLERYWLDMNQTLPASGKEAG